MYIERDTWMTEMNFQSVYSATTSSNNQSDSEMNCK